MPRTRGGHGARPPRETSGAPLLTTALNIGTLNLRGGFEAKKYELVERANEFGLDVLAVSDVRVRGQIEDELGNYRIFLSGISRGRVNWGWDFLCTRNWSLQFYVIDL